MPNRTIAHLTHPAQCCARHTCLDFALLLQPAAQACDLRLRPSTTACCAGLRPSSPLRCAQAILRTAHFDSGFALLCLRSVHAQAILGTALRTR